ncbi:MAG: TetR/AcrR family transcriptional regulator [Actinomycetota bacterium]|nr:TetR/AcrR family transcriptional regulator [Actinomycetota bacterium]
MVSSAPAREKRRRLSVEDRREELLRTCLDLLGRRPWDEVTMADVADAAGVSKPLLYHYFSTKTDLYRATVTAAADELRDATRPDPALPVGPRMRAALDAHLDWIEAHAVAYRAVIQGGISSDPVVQDVVERSRRETVDRLAEAFGMEHLTVMQRVGLRGWVGFLEWTSLEWLATKTITKTELADLISRSAAALPSLIEDGDAIRS